MGLAQQLRGLFTEKVRARGEVYAANGSVRLINREKNWASLEVEGSDPYHYAVLVDWKEKFDPELECTCPHFDDGNYCKHLWAAILVLDRMESESGQPASLPAAGSQNGHRDAPAKSASSWQQRLKQLSFSPPANDIPPIFQEPPRPRRLYYLLDVFSDQELPRIEVLQQERREDGEWEPIEPCPLEYGIVATLEDPSDRAAVGYLLANRSKRYWEASDFDDGYDDDDDFYGDYDGDHDDDDKDPSVVNVAPELIDVIFPALAATGRFVYRPRDIEAWDEARTIRWSDDPPWKFRLRAEPMEHQEGWRLKGELVRRRQRRPLTDALRCFASRRLLLDDELVPFEPPADPRWLEMLHVEERLIVPAADREALIRELWHSGRPVEVAGDKSLNVKGHPGTPRGRFVVHPPQSIGYRFRQFGPLYASVFFLYDDKEIPLKSPTASWLDAEGATVHLRNLEAESQLLARLYELKVKPKETSYYGHTPPGHVQLLPADLPEVVAALVEEGWDVEAEGQRIRRGGHIALSVRSGVDWFDLQGEVDFDGVSVSLPELLAALRNGERTIPLGDGSRGLLPQKWLEQYASLSDLGRKQEDNSLRFHRGQALLLDAMLAANEQAQTVKVDQRFATLRKQLNSFSGIKPEKPPRVFQGELREYQQEGLGWLRFLEKFQFGGCLADDMGLGKTVQVLALLASRGRRQPKETDPRPSLVVAPNSVVYNWRQEAERFAPKLKVADYTGLDRKKRVAEFGEHDLILTTYGTLRKDFERLSETPWDYAILDEAQAIKNAMSQTAKAARLLDARHRLALSGTPVENHLGELWSLFEFINPGLLGSREAFKRLTRNGGEVEPQQLEPLRKGLAPFLLRRTKTQVLPQLPEKTEQRLYCELTAAQQKQYNQLRDHYRLALTQKIAESGLAQSKIHVLEALLRLRQAACHPGLVDPKQKDNPSAKLELLLQQLKEVVEEGHKALVFSQFTTLLDIVRKRLEKEGIVYEYLDGKTRDRQARVERFQGDPNCPVFLISLKAGGSGLNLTAADFVYLLDPWWNPAVEAQAIDRTHRIGQTRPVFAYRLIARNTVEEKILELQAQKSSLAEAIISADSSLIQSLTAEDLQAIFS